MKNNKFRHFSVYALKQQVVARVALLLFVLAWSPVAFCLTDAETGEQLPFTIEFPKTQEPSFSIITDTSASFHCCPLLGKVISHYGRRGGRTHTGVDVKLKRGDTVRAALKGVVKMAQTYSGYGKLVILSHPEGYETYYAHLSKCLVSKGDTVYASQTVGLGGRTGRATTDHLHFEVRKKGVAQNPEQYFGFADGDLKKRILFGVNELFIASSTKQEASAERKDLAEKSSSSQTESTLKNEPTYASSTEVQSADSYVTIGKGDTLYSLAKRYGTSVKELQDLNNLEGSLLKIGMQLRVN